MEALHFALGLLAREHDDIDVYVSGIAFNDMPFPEFKRLMGQDRAAIAIDFGYDEENDQYANELLIKYEGGRPAGVTATGADKARRKWIDMNLRKMMGLPVGPGTRAFMVGKLNELPALPPMRHGDILALKDGTRRVVVWHPDTLCFSLEPRWLDDETEESNSRRRPPMYAFGHDLNGLLMQTLTGSFGVIVHGDAYSASPSGYTTNAVIADIDLRSASLRFIKNGSDARAELHYPLEITRKVKGAIQYLNETAGAKDWSSTDLVIELAPTDITVRRLIPDDAVRSEVAGALKVTYIEKKNMPYSDLEVRIGKSKKTLRYFDANAILENDVKVVSAFAARKRKGYTCPPGQAFDPITGLCQ